MPAGSTYVDDPGAQIITGELVREEQKLGEVGEVGPSWAWHGRERLAGSGQIAARSGMAAVRMQEQPCLSVMVIQRYLRANKLNANS